MAKNQHEELIIEKKDNQDKIEISQESNSDINDKQRVKNIIKSGLKKTVRDKPKNNAIIREEEMLVCLTPIKPDIIGIYEYPVGMYNSYKPLENHQEDNSVFGNLAIQELRNRILHKNVALNINKIDFWMAAEAGVKSFNYLTESEVRLDKKLNSEGKVIAFALNSESFSISSSRIK